MSNLQLDTTSFGGRRRHKKSCKPCKKHRRHRSRRLHGGDWDSSPTTTSPAYVGGRCGAYLGGASEPMKLLGGNSEPEKISVLGGRRRHHRKRSCHRKKSCHKKRRTRRH